MTTRIIECFSLQMARPSMCRCHATNMQPIATLSGPSSCHNSEASTDVAAYPPPSSSVCCRYVAIVVLLVVLLMVMLLPPLSPSVCVQRGAARFAVFWRLQRLYKLCTALEMLSDGDARRSMRVHNIGSRMSLRAEATQSVLHSQKKITLI